MHAWRNPKFAAVLQRADLRVPDGIGVLWAACLQGKPLQERVTGSDGIYHICERAAQVGWRVYFLGAKPGVATGAAAALQQKYSGLIVTGAESGNPTDAEWPLIQQRLAGKNPNIPATLKDILDITIEGNVNGYQSKAKEALKALGK